VVGCGEAAGVKDRTSAGRGSGDWATDREVSVVAAVLTAGSEKAADHRLGLSHSTVKHHLANARSNVGATTTAELVWILGPWLPEPEGMAQAAEKPPALRLSHSKRITPHLHRVRSASAWSSPRPSQSICYAARRPSAIRLGAAPNSGSGTVS
jgi:DNA-binding CsgD family transcriptional regulator